MFDIPAAIQAVATVVDDAIKRIWPDATEIEKAKIAQLTQEIQNQYNLTLQQISVDIEEAKHPSLFVAGWRPFIGWVCGLGLAYSGLLQPLLAWLSLHFLWPIPPVIDTAPLLTMLGGLLGLGTLRTYEKQNSVDTKKIK